MATPIKDLKPKEIGEILSTYLTDHSARKFNFVFWNIVDSKTGVLCFVNTIGDKLTRINNPDLGFRMVKVKSTAHWRMIRHLFNDILMQNTNKRNVGIIRIDYLMSYLKTLKYDFSAIELDINRFGTRSVNAPNGRVKVLCTLSNDIHSHYLISNLYEAYSPYLSDKADRDPELSCSEGNDIDSEDFIESKNDYKYILHDEKLIVPTINGLDTISIKVLKDTISREVEYTNEYIEEEGDVFKLLSRFSNDKINVVSIRVYLSYFMKVLKSKRRKRNE